MAFDASGNLIQTGDMIVAVIFIPGVAPAVECENMGKPVPPGARLHRRGLVFNASYDPASSPFGYALSFKNRYNGIRAGISNYSATPRRIPPMLRPGGPTVHRAGAQHMNRSNLLKWDLNLTRIG